MEALTLKEDDDFPGEVDAILFFTCGDGAGGGGKLDILC